MRSFFIAGGGAIEVGPLAYRFHKAMVSRRLGGRRRLIVLYKFWRRVSEILAPTGGLIWSRGNNRFEVAGATSRPINMQAAYSGDGGF